MSEDRFIKVYPVRQQGEKYIVEGNLKTQRSPKFLAAHPLNSELFLLSGDNGYYQLLKGNVKKGLRFCLAIRVILVGGCFVFHFAQDEQNGVITDPDCFPEKNPQYGDCIGGCLVDLKVVPFSIAD
jgi:hypothetical protein